MGLRVESAQLLGNWGRTCPEIGEADGTVTKGQCEIGVEGFPGICRRADDGHDDTQEDSLGEP